MIKNSSSIVSEKNPSATHEPLTPGQQLRRAREAKNLTQEAVAKQLFINKQIIIALEEDNYNKLVAPVYARGYLLSCARVLQLPAELLLTEFDNITAQSKNNPLPMKILQDITIHQDKEHQHHWLSYTAIFIILSALALWGYHHYQQITAGKVLEKATNTNINTPRVTIPDADNKMTTTFINIPQSSVTSDMPDKQDMKVDQ